LIKPSTCSSCVLYIKGSGFARADGPNTAKILIVGEALGQREVIEGKPFVGDAGAMLDRILRLAKIDRRSIKIGNVISCRPPQNWLDGAPWEIEALDHCEQYVNQTIAEMPNLKVIVPMGVISTRRFLGLPSKTGKGKDFHGTVTKHPHGYYIIPTICEVTKECIPSFDNLM